MTGRDGRVRCKDAGSLDMRHIGATEAAASAPASAPRRHKASLRNELTHALEAQLGRAAAL